MSVVAVVVLSVVVVGSVLPSMYVIVVEARSVVVNVVKKEVDWEVVGRVEVETLDSTLKHLTVTHSVSNLKKNKN